MNLNDTHLVLLSAAVQRDDHLILRPEEITTKAAEKLAAKLIRLGAAEEVRVGPDQPRWREEDDTPVGLRITTAALAALGIEGGQGSQDGANEPTPASAPAKAGPRAGSKQAQVLEMLGRESGATLDDLVAATGWLPHTTRAALTGLRKKGHQLVKSKEEHGTVYRIGVAEAAQHDGGAE
jgi:hypothetical protein